MATLFHTYNLTPDVADGQMTPTFYSLTVLDTFNRPRVRDGSAVCSPGGEPASDEQSRLRLKVSKTVKLKKVCAADVDVDVTRLGGRRRIIGVGFGSSDSRF